MTFSPETKSRISASLKAYNKTPEGRLALQNRVARSLLATVGSKRPRKPEEARKLAQRMVEHDTVLLNRVRALVNEKGADLLFVDYKGWSRPDIIYVLGGHVIGEDVKYDGRIEKELDVEVN